MRCADFYGCRASWKRRRWLAAIAYRSFCAGTAAAGDTKFLASGVLSDISWKDSWFTLIPTQTDAAMTYRFSITGRVTQYEIMGYDGAAEVVDTPSFFAMAVQGYLVHGLSLGAVKGR